MRAGFLRLRRDRRGVSPAFAEVLMVVTTVAMGASVYLMYAAVAEQTATIPPSFSFRSITTQPSQVPEYCCLNDTIVDIIASVGNPQIWGPAMEFTISSPGDGAVMMQGYLEEEPNNITLIYLGVYWGSSQEASICNLWYSDIDRNGIVSIADHISLRGMSKEFHGAVLRLIADERTVGTQVLP